MKITSLTSAVDVVRGAFAQHPERNGMDARMSAHEGRRRHWPAMYIHHLAVPGDTTNVPREYSLPDVDMPESPARDLALELVGLLSPLDMLNPISPVLGLGRGTGTMVTAFGVPLNPGLGNAPAFTRTLADVLGDPPPTVETAGLAPEMVARIGFLKDHLPPFFKIALPDMQGPYNIVHALVGEDALVGPYTEPDRFHELMDRVTTYWIECRRFLLERIGPEYRVPWESSPRIAECSVNLVGYDTYREHILPHDLRIATELGPPQIHTCSGPHVFRATMKHLPLIETECGRIACAVAGATTVEEAFAAVRGKPILLNVGQELPKDFDAAYDMVRQDLDLFEEHPRMIFAYTGMDWRRKDRPAVRALHRELDDYWAKRYS